MKYLLLLLLPFFAYSTDFSEEFGNLQRTYIMGNCDRFTYSEWQGFSDNVRQALYLNPNAMYENFSDYGIVGDGITDDTSALQAAFDNAGILVNDIDSSTFMISARLDFDQSFTHTIDWNNAVLTTNTNLVNMIRIDKRISNGGSTNMTNLIVDGNDKATYGFFLFTRVNFSNVDIMNLLQVSGGSSPAGIRMDLYDDDDVHGDWVFDGCDISNLKGLIDNDIGGAQGAANGFLMYWRENPVSATNIMYKNAVIHDCFGEDAQTIAIFSPGLDISNTPSGIVFDNMEMYNWERRNLKLFASNITFKNSLIKDTPANHVGLTGGQASAGMIAAGRGSGSTGGNNISFISCEFQSLQNGRDQRVIFIDAYHFSLENCSFTGGADLRFTRTIGDGSICNTKFEAGSSISSYTSGATNVDDGEITLDTDNIYQEGIESAIAGLTDYSTIEADIDCTEDVLSTFTYENNLNLIRLFQNPVNNEIRIISKHTFSSYQIFSLNGSIVKQGGIVTNQNYITIMITNLEKGIYFLQLNDNNEKRKASLKVMKN